MHLFLALVLVSLGAHRLWNYEAVFARPRQWVLALRLTPLSCAACNAFWVAAAVSASALALGLVPWWEAAGFPLAAYPVLRSAVWLYAQPEPATLLATAHLRTGTLGTPSALAVAAPPRPEPTTPAVKPADPTVGCKTCEEKRNAFMTERLRTDAYRRRVILLAPTAVPLDRAVERAKVAAAADRQTLFQIWIPMDGPLGRDLPQIDGATNIEYRRAIPSLPPVPEGDNVKVLADALRNHLIWLGNATIVSFDLFVDPAQAALAKAIERIADTPAFSWLYLFSPAQFDEARLPDAVRRVGHTAGINDPTASALLLGNHPRVPMAPAAT